MKILIKVTKEILDRSKDCRINVTENCAVALALRDLFPDCSVRNRSVYVYQSLVYISECLLPSIASDFIYRFDLNSPDERVKMSPISFEIDVPDRVINEIGIDTVYRVLSESKTLEHVNP